MARNFVEYHIQEGAFHTFKVNAGETVKIGQFVEIKGDRTVGVPSAGSTKVVGLVYSGTVGIDGINDGYKGDNGDVVTVIALKPLVYVEAGGTITAGDMLEVDASGNVLAHSEGGTYSANESHQKVGLALAGATTGERFLAMLV